MFYYFFFFKQKTAYEMRISDWSSDVCSSDLVQLNVAEWADGMHAHPLATLPAPAHLPPAGEGARRADEGASAASCFWVSPESRSRARFEIGRASCRERVCQYV